MASTALTTMESPIAIDQSSGNPNHMSVEKGDTSTDRRYAEREVHLSPVAMLEQHMRNGSVSLGASSPSIYAGTANSSSLSLSQNSNQLQHTRHLLATTSSSNLLDAKSEVMCNWLHVQQLKKMWNAKGPGEGVLLKKSRGNYTCCPNEMAAASPELYQAIKKLNVKCALTIKTKMIELILSRDELSSVPLGKESSIQILPDVLSLPNCQKHHFAAFIRDPAILLVWDDDPIDILDRGQRIQDKLLDMLWNRVAVEENDKDSLRGGDGTTITPEGDTHQQYYCQTRQTVIIQPCLTGFVLILMCTTLGAAWRSIAIEIKAGSSWTPLAFLAVVPFQCCLSLFFMQAAIQGIAAIFGPLGQISANTKYFSGKPPPRISREMLPHVTIQCPVYKEGLWSVIDPTVRSLKNAISTYEMQGGTASIFVNDDGMQLLCEEKVQERKLYYEEHDIAWVARPAHDPAPSDTRLGFVRGGKFKKASNMNHALRLSVQLEDAFKSISNPHDNQLDFPSGAIDSVMTEVLEKDKFGTWAGGNVRIGDYILLVDSDTRVPADCFLDAVSEMELCQEIAILQFTSGILNVTTSWFEKGLTFFNNLIYTCISYAVANGDVSPFVGHNAFLRWSAIQDVAFLPKDANDPYPDCLTYWSEDAVSEDFDMSLRLQSAGYIVKLATYAGDGFKEGVSLTVYDEIARWEKYAYGVSELIFHPLIHWPFRGPFKPLFYDFIRGPIPLASKLTILAYMGNYFSLGSAWYLNLLNYFLFGWFNTTLDHYYMDSFKIYLSLVLVFTILGNLSLAILRHRTCAKSLGRSLLENITWIPLLVIFFGGISLHVSKAILCHLFSVNMSWGATAKEATQTTLFKEMPAILKKYKFCFLFCGCAGCVMVILAGVGPLGELIPWDWRIDLFAAIWPLGVIVVSHALLPLVLNPGLMQLTF